MLAQSMFSDADTLFYMTSFLPETDFVLELDLNHALRTKIMFCNCTYKRIKYEQEEEKRRGEGFASNQ